MTNSARSPTTHRVAAIRIKTLGGVRFHRRILGANIEVQPAMGNVQRGFRIRGARSAGKDEA